MKRLFSLILLLLIAVIGTLLLAPGFVNWNPYRGRVAEELSTMLGRTVAISGDLRFGLLPQPYLSVGEVGVGSISGADAETVLHLDQLDLEIGLFPLLSGRIEVAEIGLVGPEANLEILPDGRRSWALGGGEQGSNGAGVPAIRLERVEIEGGHISFLDHNTGLRETVRGITATATAETLLGPYQVGGTFMVRGLPLRAEVSAGRTDANGPIPVRILLGPADIEASAFFSGRIAMAVDQPQVTGDARIEGPDLADAIATVAAALPELDLSSIPREPLATSFRLTSNLFLAPGRVEARAIDARLGDATARGEVKAQLGVEPDIDLTLAVARLAVDPWLEVPGDQTPAMEAGSVDLETLLASVPDNVSLGLDLSADDLLYRDGAIGQATLKASVRDGGVAVERFAVTGPGGAGMSLTASLRSEAGVPTASAQLEAAADDLRQTLKWLGIQVGDVPENRLGRFAFLGQVQGSPRDFQLSGLDVQLDATRLLGGLAYLERAGRPAVGMRLEVDRFDLDSYQGKSPAETAAGDPGGGLDWGSLARFLSLGDASLDARVGSLTAGGTTVEGLALDATLSGGSVTVRSARFANLAGLSATVHGRLVETIPPRGVDAQITAQAADVGQVLTALGFTPPPAVERIGPASLNGRVTGDLGALSTEVKASAAGGTIDVGGTIGMQAAGPGFDLKLRSTYPEFGHLVRLVMPDYRPGGGDPGPFDLYTAVTGDRGQVRITDLQGTVGGVSVRGAGRVELAGHRPTLDAEIQTGTIVVDRFLPGPTGATVGYAPRDGRGQGSPWPTDPIDTTGLDAFDASVSLTSASIQVQGHALTDPALTLSLRDGSLILEGFGAGLMGGQLGATARLDTAGGGVASSGAVVSLTGAEIRQALLDSGFASGPIDIVRGTMDLAFDLTAEGASPAALVGSLAGNGTIAIKDGRLRGVDLERVTERVGRFIDDPGSVVSVIGRPDELITFILRNLKSGATAFSLLDGTYVVEDGVARTDDISIAAGGGRVDMRGSVDLPRWLADLALDVRLQEDPPLPPFVIRLQGPLTGLDRTVELGDLETYLVERAAAAALETVVPGGASVDLERAPQQLFEGIFGRMR